MEGWEFCSYRIRAYRNAPRQISSIDNSRMSSMGKGVAGALRAPFIESTAKWEQLDQTSASNNQEYLATQRSAKQLWRRRTDGMESEKGF